MVQKSKVKEDKQNEWLFTLSGRKAAIKLVREAYDDTRAVNKRGLFEGGAVGGGTTLA